MATELHREPWNEGSIVGQKAPPGLFGYLGIEVDDALEMAEQTEV